MFICQVSGFILQCIKPAAFEVFKVGHQFPKIDVAICILV